MIYSDYINPIDLCNRLNTYIIPEAAVHAFLTFLFLINGYWLAILLNLPLLAWNAKKYVNTREDKRSAQKVTPIPWRLLLTVWTESLRTSTYWTRPRFSGS